MLKTLREVREALRQASEPLGVLRRAYGLDTEELCYPTVNSIYDVLPKITYLIEAMESPEMVEKIARALCKHKLYYGLTIEPDILYELVEREWKDQIPQAKAVLAALGGVNV